MQKSILLRALQQEIRRHDFNYFVHGAVINRAGRERCGRAWISGLHEAHQHDEPILRSSGGRRNAYVD